MTKAQLSMVFLQLRMPQGLIWVFFRLRSSGVFLILSSLTKNLTHKMVTLKVSKALKAGCTTSALSWIPSVPGPYKKASYCKRFRSVKKEQPGQPVPSFKFNQLNSYSNLCLFYRTLQTYRTQPFKWSKPVSFILTTTKYLNISAFEGRRIL